MNESIRQRFAAIVEYDGRGFNGWQRQAGQPSVQQAVEQALSRVADEPVTVTTAGRTDTGVHASGQVIHFDSSRPRRPYAWLRGANTSLPPGVALLEVQAVTREFHARFAATGRCYRYVILNRPVRPALLAGRVSWHYRPLALEPMRRAARTLVGKHDFSAYRAVACQSRSPVRVVRRLEVSCAGQWLWFDIEADGFLHHMVRNIVGVLTAIGAGTRPTGWAAEVLAARDRTRGGITAPPDGLYLAAVHYPAQFGLTAPPACRFW